MKSPFLYSTIALAMLSVTGGAYADNTTPADKSKQTIENVTNYGTVKGSTSTVTTSTTTSSGNNSEKAKAGDKASDFRPPQKPLKTNPVP